MIDDNQPPFVIHSPTRVTLSALAVEMAKQNGMTPTEMARHLLQQDAMRQAGEIQRDKEN
jgi:hypothetical protein